VARRYEPHPNLVPKWVKAYEQGQLLGEGIVQHTSSAEVKKLEEENE
jgi:transposase-like protein